MSSKKNIFITRHGHADFNASSDFERILTSRGKRAVLGAANFIQSQCKLANITPQLCISSAAIRTKQTAEILCKTNNISQCDFYQELYSITASSWLDKITQSTQENIILVGHNPTLSQLINVLSDDKFYMQPANCAFITLEIKLDGFIYPATLNSFYKNEDSRPTK